ncbi:hypothetical protein COOONC_08619, partial [Cooperia oncophora]
LNSSFAEPLRDKGSGDVAPPARSESAASKSSESAAKLTKLNKKKNRNSTETGSTSLLKSQRHSNAKESQIPTEPLRHKRRGDLAAPARSETTLKSQESVAKLKKINKEKDWSSAKTEGKSLLNSQAYTNAKQSQIPIDHGLKIHQFSSEELHPSWAARRRAKEQQSSAPKGKRIVFSDD